MTRTVIALGGNTLAPTGDADHETQVETMRETVHRLDALLSSDSDVVWTHGNGPQVGNRLLEQEAAETPAMPLDVLVAETQGQTGYLLGRVLDAAREGPTLTVTTRVVVDPDDPAFESPSKPVGPHYTREEAESKPFETAVVESGERPYRRVVASPKPERVVEGEEIASLVDRGVPVVCCGGGGIPVVETDDGQEGRAAVVDKDYTSALLGRQIGAEELLFVTDVAHAYLAYDTDDQRPIAETDPETLRQYIADGEFGTGSMRPKAEACASFVEGGGSRAVVTRPEDVEAALAGETGTQVR
jgi:carbamate kinase